MPSGVRHALADELRNRERGEHGEAEASQLDRSEMKDRRVVQNAFRIHGVEYRQAGTSPGIGSAA